MGVWLMRCLPPSSRQRRERDDRLSDLLDRCGDCVLLRRVLDGEGYEVNGDCNICINGKLPSYSASCIECGLLRKNYKPMTNADRIRAMTDEDLSRFLEGVKLYFVNPTDIILCKNCLHEDCCDCWLDWLRRPVEVDKE